MRKFTLLMICASMFVLLSCNKTYTCECIITSTWPDEFDEEPEISYIISDFEAKSLKKAQTECEVEAFQSLGGMTQKTVCKLK
jgi:hypothetical protein